MCGIVGVLSRPDNRPAPDVAELAVRLGAASEAIRAWGTADAGGDATLTNAVFDCEEIIQALRGFVGLRVLLDHAPRLQAPVRALDEAVSRFEKLLDQRASNLGTARVEAFNALLTRAKDALFTLARDRLGNMDKVRSLSCGSTTEGHLRAAYDLNVALNAIDRLEVRGRDSAGVHLFLRGNFKDLIEKTGGHLEKRLAIPHFTHRAVRSIPLEGDTEVLSFVYKVAAEVGELGDNVRALRSAIAGDKLLHELLEAPGVTADILGHTRWASVGVISEPNAHPLNPEPAASGSAYLVSVLNGDVDNYKDLVREEGLSIAPEITTDAKVIPMLVSRAQKDGRSTREAFRRVVNRFEGSVAIAVASAQDPGKLFLALRGSGQALYVGSADSAYIIASEPYGIVEETAQYVRLDGEAPADPGNLSSRGQILILDGSKAGDREGITRIAYDGTPLPLSQNDFKRAAITTRDVDRGEHRHFLKKEIAEAPDSFSKTLRGRLAVEGGITRVTFGEESLPEEVVDRVANGVHRRIIVIGQGTAAVAGRGVAEAIREALRETSIAVEAMPATELSGFHLRDDMSDTLIVAISQSGTTTDTNRTVDLVRTRGAAVLGIVNRRHSDLTERVDGVIYTSDGRDVEMSVASTKAFYSQIAAGLLLGEALAQACGVGDEQARSRFLQELSALPDALREVLSYEETIARVADETAPPRRHWAIVGNGRNQVAAQEIRIKLSELCYKSIACDFTEDKKHIDLSSEPLILVCAAGLEGGCAADVVKEVEIYAAHKACPIVITTKGENRFDAASATLFVPAVNPRLAFILVTMVGHIYGYHAAQAIDRLARPLQEARGTIETSALVPSGGDLRISLAPRLKDAFRCFSEWLRTGRYNGTLEAATASQLSLLFRYALRSVPLEFFAEDFQRVGTPGAAIEEFTSVLNRGIEELLRPIDAIKHQAKTVTVGTSRADEALLGVPLVRRVLEAGATRELLAYQDLLTLRALDPALEEIAGYTRYAVEGATNGATIRVVSKGGICADLESRTDRDPRLRGTKNTVARERRVLVAVGRSDSRTIILVPECEGNVCAGIVLLHGTFPDHLDANTLRTVLRGYHNRYTLIRDAVAETNGESWSDDVLERIPIVDLLTKPVAVLADQVAAVMH